MGSAAAAGSLIKAWRSLADEGGVVFRREKTALGAHRAPGPAAAGCGEGAGRNGRGVIAYAGTNACHLLLTRGSVAVALAGRAAAAYHPAWLHAEYQPARARGHGGFNSRHISNPEGIK